MSVSDTLINTLFDGRYRILRKLGSGGMANVYLAEDEDLGRRVAIKIMSARYADDDTFNERFRREAKAAAALSHPNIVSIYDRGQADGTPYIAMEVIEGRSLKELVLARGPLPIDQAVDFTKQMLAALRFAHRNGIIHRDIKPHNILVGAENRLKVTDFGIARAGASQMTEVGSIMGTAQYLSPEQARGAPVAASSDLYSVGIVLYELLTGQTPFNGETAIEIAMKHVNETPKPPSELRHGIPPELDQIVLRALAKNPEDRYQSAEEMEEDLDRLDAGIPVSPETAAAATAVLRGAVPPATAATQVIGPDAATRTRIAPPAATPPRRPSYPPGYGYEEPPRKRRRWLPWLLVAALLVAAALAGWYVFSQVQNQLDSSKPVAVPYVVGIRERLAVGRVRDAGLTPDVKHRPSTKPEGYVYDQDPNGGNHIPKGDKVTIWVSTGAPQATVPSVVGTNVDAAVAKLAQVKLQATIKHAYSTKPADRVLKQNPRAGERVDQGSSVVLTVSRGAKPVSVPNVVGMSQDNAQSTLANSGFTVSTVEQNSDAPKGTVVDQSPNGGSEAPDGSTVTITVSKGPETVSVPNVVGDSRQVAEQHLKDQGFQPNVVKQDTSDPTQDDIVVDQNPAGGSQAKKGSQVTIFVGHLTTATGNGNGNGGGGG
jgi:eukaryotic-like serine/threonine-protein kinase